MLESLSLSKLPRFLRSFGGQVAMSVAVSAAGACVLAVPEFVFGQAGMNSGASPGIAISRTSTPILPQIADGKIVDRYGDAAGEDVAEPRRGGLIMPASLAMPMAVSWPQAAPPVPEAQPRAPEPLLVTATSDILPPRRPAAIGEPARSVDRAAPLQIVPPAVAAARAAEAEAPRAPAGLFSRVVVAPVARVSETVSGAAGLVGASGSWTVAQAAGLLPRW